MNVNNLQTRASAHLNAIIDLLVNETTIEPAEDWKSTIRHLVREVVSSVDPNVKQGDSIDIRNYVKLKIIPGGSMDECTFVNGVVFQVIKKINILIFNELYYRCYFITLKYFSFVILYMI